MSMNATQLTDKLANCNSSVYNTPDPRSVVGSVAGTKASLRTCSTPPTATALLHTIMHFLSIFCIHLQHLEVF